MATEFKIPELGENVTAGDVVRILVKAGDSERLPSCRKSVRVTAMNSAALTPLPVLAVPMESASLKGLDSLLSMVQMPGGLPVATFAIGKPGAINAALFATSILAIKYPQFRANYEKFRQTQTEKVIATSVLR